MSTLRHEIFDPDRTEIFQKLKPFNRIGVLAGGSALALQLGHRKSFDFDIFISKPLSTGVKKKIIDIFGYGIDTKINTSDIMMLTTSKHVDIHVVYVWYKRISKTITTSSLPIASITDIAADKAYTIGRRGQWRDYVDIFFLLKKNIFGLSQIIELAQKKYKPEFSVRQFLEQLCYFDDINDFTITFLQESYPVEEIKRYLINKVKDYKLI